MKDVTHRTELLEDRRRKSVLDLDHVFGLRDSALLTDEEPRQLDRVLRIEVLIEHADHGGVHRGRYPCVACSRGGDDRLTRVAVTTKGNGRRERAAVTRIRQPRPVFVR